jgi:hypothetical protein
MAKNIESMLTFLCVFCIFWSISIASSDFDDDFVRENINEAPSVNDAHTVQFYIIESSFPYNAPVEIQ